MLTLVTASILAQVALFSIPATQTPPIKMALVNFQALVRIIVGVGVIRALTARGNNIVAIILCSLNAFAPCGIVLPWLMVNMSVTGTLCRAGIRLGFMGAKDDDVARAHNPMLSDGGGYDLTGNVMLSEVKHLDEILRSPAAISE